MIKMKTGKLGEGMTLHIKKRDLLTEVLNNNRYFIGCCFWFLAGGFSMAILLLVHLSKIL